MMLMSDKSHNYVGSVWPNNYVSEKKKERKLSVSEKKKERKVECQ